MGRLKCFDRNEVLDTAIQLFWKKGYVDTSLSDIEKATGVNKSGLYSEFKDKDDIFFESLKRYYETNPVVPVLKIEPLGWNNIEFFFKTSMRCGGCFMANTIREYSILPSKIRQIIEQKSLISRELILRNIKATKTKNDPEALTDLIMTYATGISLKLNMMKPEDLKKEMESFLEICKK